jgi:hypothetical protein
MRKKIVFFIIAAFILFQSSSPWEGSAVIAPEGELPATGFFIATNSFPRNRVVDITNIETGKSTRVIVASTLNSPGLIAAVSREAAELIGMRQGSISRIRMVQPSDPIAYLRFTEGLASGNPVFGSGNVLGDFYRDDTYVPPANAQERTAPVISGLTGPNYILEPEWRNREIVDFPFQDNQPPVSETPPPVVVTFPPVEEAQPPVEEIPPPVAETPPIVTETLPPVEEIPPPVVEQQPPVEETPPAVAEIEESEPVNESITETLPTTDRTEFSLEPTDKRPPDQRIYGIDPSDIIPSLPPITSVQEKPVVPVVPENLFSVRGTTELVRGMFYVQLAAFETPELVENAIRQIDRNYWPLVYVAGDNYFRILLGPFNQGESAAVLQRFRTIGYNDAFVRHVR